MVQGKDVRKTLDLSTLNTLALPCIASNALVFETLTHAENELPRLIFDEPPLVFGGGSNLILPQKLTRPLIRFVSPQLQFHTQSSDHVIVEADAGVVWDDLVAQTVGRGLRGLENLSLIPGTVGAAPVQNIGAYGVEIADCLLDVYVYDFQRKTFFTLRPEECDFGYRDSVFKQQLGRYLILRVRLNLSTVKPFQLDYGELRSLASETVLKAEQSRELNVERVRQRVIEVRQAKLPDPELLPNAGSFFKNPLIHAEHLSALLEIFPKLIYYPLSNGEIKLAAGWMIDHAGWKGFRHGAVGVHDKQALVIVNHDDATQKEILELAHRIQGSIQNMFQVTLEIEPIVIEAALANGA